MVNKSYLLKYAVDYLSRYNSTKKNLERILKSKILRISKDKLIRYRLFTNIPYVIKELEKNKFINDEIFTQNKILNFANQGKSKNYIYNYLLKNGVDKILINNQLNEFSDKNNNWENKSAFIFAKKKKLFEKDENYEKKLAKMARAGFPYELSRMILKK